MLSKLCLATCVIMYRGVGRYLQGGFPGIRGTHKCTWSTDTKGVWRHAPPGKFCIFRPCEIISGAFWGKEQEFYEL